MYANTWRPIDSSDTRLKAIIFEKKNVFKVKGIVYIYCEVISSDKQIVHKIDCISVNVLPFVLTQISDHFWHKTAVCLTVAKCVSSYELMPNNQWITSSPYPLITIDAISPQMFETNTTFLLSALSLGFVSIAYIFYGPKQTPNKRNGKRCKGLLQTH